MIEKLKGQEITFTGNSLDWDKPVHVYKNLHKNMWSIRQRGRVVAHTNKVFLKGVTFHVQPAGRKRVIAEKKKNVHAYIKGVMVHPDDLRVTDPNNYSFASYNPYKAETFIDKCTNEPIHKADFVDMMVDEDEPVLILNKWRN